LAAISLAAFGLDEVGGLVWRGLPEINEIPNLLAAHPELAQRVRDVLDNAYAAARGLIWPRIAAVKELAQVLVSRRILDGPDAEEIVRRHFQQGGEKS
jgi:hypothetical protein